MLADFADQLRDGIPVPVAAGMVELADVLRSFGLEGSIRRGQLRGVGSRVEASSYTHDSTSSGGCPTSSVVAPSAWREGDAEEGGRARGPRGGGARLSWWERMAERGRFVGVAGSSLNTTWR